jgi:REP element-mobilizing transposase RayT
MYARRERRSRAALAQTPVVLPRQMRQRVGLALQQKLSRLGAWVLCLAVAGQHVHMLVKLSPKLARRLVGQAKKHATFEMREQGWKGKLWGLRAKVTLVQSRGQQVNTYRYIIRHAAQGAWIGVWKKEGGELEEL